MMTFNQPCKKCVLAKNICNATLPTITGSVKKNMYCIIHFVITILTDSYIDTFFTHNIYTLIFTY